MMSLHPGERAFDAAVAPFRSPAIASAPARTRRLPKQGVAEIKFVARRPRAATQR